MNKTETNNKIYRLFMEALKAHLHGNGHVDWTEEISLEEWVEIYQMAASQKVLPMIYEATFGCPSFNTYKAQLVGMVKQQVLMNVFNQAMMTTEFLELYKMLGANDIHPIVVKGILCRNIFPEPDHRPSGDEDIVVLPDEWIKCHDLMKAYGMIAGPQYENVEQLEEVAYGKMGSPIYVEVHNGLFVSTSEAYGELNELFEGYEKRTMDVEIQGVKIRSLSYTDHFAYLVLHAFKHFLHSGFGIRQVCDVILFGRTYKEEIDWKVAFDILSAARADQFTLAMFEIGSQYMDFDIKELPLPEKYASMSVDPDPMLSDLLSGGIYGATDAARQHSSNITLSAVIESKKGKKSNRFTSILFSVCKPLDYMKKQYKFLEKAPFLLPIAWVLRVKDYLKHSGGEENGALESVDIGNKRVELLKKYDII